MKLGRIHHSTPYDMAGGHFFMYCFEKRPVDDKVPATSTGGDNSIGDIETFKKFGTLLQRTHLPG